jgi:hypothetical protein
MVYLWYLALPYSNVNIDLFDESHLILPEARLKIYLECSGSYSLDVSLGIEHVEGVEWEKCQALQLLFTSSERWRSLDLQVELTSSASSTLPSLEGKLPNLQLLSIQILHGADNVGYLHRAFKETPSLIHLQLHFSPTTRHLSLDFSSFSIIRH